MFLTLPADVSARNFIEQRRSIYHTLEIMLEKREVFHILFSCLGGPLERLESSKLQLKEEDGKIIQLFLTFIRNCLISDEKHKQLADMKFTIYIKERIVKVFFDTGMIDVLTQVAKDIRKKPFSDDSTLLTEIFHLIFQSCTPHQLLHGLDDNGLKDNQTGQPDTFKRRGRIFAVRHGRFGGRSLNPMASRSTKNLSVMISRKYFGEAISFDFPNVALFQAPIRQRLLELAKSLLKGAFNEILLASWISIRHQQQNESEEKALHTHSLLSLSLFFVSFIQLSCEIHEMDAPNISGVSNLFDKEVFSWLHMIWTQAEDTKNTRGMVLVSGLVKEMFALMTTIMLRGVQSDRFACEAVLSEILVNSKIDGYLQRASSGIRAYRTGEAPLMYLANAIEVLHLGYRLKCLTEPNFIIDAKDMFHQKTISNHIRLLAFSRLNSKRLNLMLIKYVEEIIGCGMDNMMHDLTNLQILFQVALEDQNEALAHSAPSGGISAVITNFMKSIYAVEAGDRSDFKRRKYLGTVCS